MTDTDSDNLKQIIDFLSGKVLEFGEAVEVYHLLTLAIERYLLEAPPEQCEMLLRLVGESGYNERFATLVAHINAPPAGTTLH